MSKVIEIEDICKKIYDLEAEYDLLHYQINGIYLWQYIRFKVYKAITIQTKLYSTDHTKKVKGKDILKALPGLIFHSIFYNPLTGNYKKDFLLFNDSRKVLFENEFIEIYSNFHLKNVDDEKFEIIEEPYVWKHYGKTKPNQKNLDYLYFRSYFLNLFTKIKFSKTELVFLTKIEAEINSYFSIEINLKSIIESGLKLFKNDYKYYRKILQKRQPKFVLMVFSYEKRKALVAACKDLNIPSFELQHGTTSPFHVGYHYPNTRKPIKYFPDYYISFGRFWQENVNLPIDKENIIIGGFPYFSLQKSKYSNLKRVDNQILFISQGTIGERLSGLALKLAKKLPEFQIIFKLHPGEYNRWKSEYVNLIEFISLNNTMVVDDNSINLYQLFGESSFQVGVYSTAIFEGISFGLKTFIVNLPGSEYLDKAVELNLVKKINSEDDMIENLNSFENQEIQKDYFFDESVDFKIKDIYKKLGIQY